MTTLRRCLVFGLLVFTSLHAIGSAAVELDGTVQKVSADTIVIKLNSQFLPRRGDSAKVTTDHASLGTLTVGTWRVTQITKDVVVAAKLNATGEAKEGMRVVIDSANPVSRSDLASPKPATAAAVAQPVAAPAPRVCSMRSSSTNTLDCPGRSVYAGPTNVGKHGGVCLDAGECKLYSWKTGFKLCGPYAVYAGPTDVRRHGGYCVLLDEPGYRLRATSTASKSCGVGVYAGPNQPEKHEGVCLEVVRGTGR